MKPCVKRTLVKRSQMKTAILKLESFSVRYAQTTAVRGISLEVGDGEMVALVGANGAGKSSLLKGILGVDGSVQGRVVFDGNPIEGLPTHQRVGDGLALVPEGRHVFSKLTVLDNLELGFARGAKGDYPARLERVFQLFPILTERRAQAAGTLSGGEQQMLAIGRALMSAPRLLMLDEPTLGLAPIIVSQLGEILRSLRDGGQAILLAEQNARMSLGVSDRAYVLAHGSVVREGRSSDLINSDEIRKVYLGM
jgi:branched-chain amino acid transport system ATP-binding protein